MNLFGLQVARGYEAVVMDFGSARHMPHQIRNRTEALTLQEEAEVGAGQPCAGHASLFQVHTTWPRKPCTSSVFGVITSHGQQLQVAAGAVMHDWCCSM